MIQQWEYNKQFWIYQGDIQELQMLDSFGRLGWENYHKEKQFYYFKRPIPQPSTAEKIFNEAVKEATDELSGRHPLE